MKRIVALKNSSTKGAEKIAGPAPADGSTPPSTESIEAIHVLTYMLAQQATEPPQENAMNQIGKCLVRYRSSRMNSADHTAAVGQA